MKKFSRGQVILSMAVLTILSIGITFAMFNAKFTSDTKETICWFHIMVNTFSVCLSIILGIVTIQELVMIDDDGDDHKDGWLYPYYYTVSELRQIKRENDLAKSRGEAPVSDVTSPKPPFNVKKLLYWIIGIVALFYIFGFFNTAVKDCSKIYNTHKGYLNSYTQKGQEKVGFYDKLWKTYLQKEKITNVNKETFIQVTKIIMENRKDGEQIMWKFISENQQIPYEEFSKFYADLSDFICKQREGYFNIEKECQAIANRNNTLLDTFPNNMYNKILGCQRIKFEYGFTSDSTDNVFKSKKENIK